MRERGKVYNQPVTKIYFWCIKKKTLIEFEVITIKDFQTILLKIELYWI